jgi:hypothetical protein
MSKGVSLQSIAIYRAGHYWEDPQVIHLDDGVAGKHLLIEEYGIFLGDYLPLPALLWCPCWLQTTTTMGIFLISYHHPICHARVGLFFWKGNVPLGHFYKILVIKCSTQMLWVIFVPKTQEVQIKIKGMFLDLVHCFED